jgi:DNA repair protein RadC
MFWRTIFFKKKIINTIPLLFNPEVMEQLQPVFEQDLRIKNSYEFYSVLWSFWNKGTISKREEVYVLFLKYIKKDRNYKVLGVGLEAIGTEESVSVIGRRIIERAKEVGATGIVESHNHTTKGNVNPSISDISSFVSLHGKLQRDNLEYYDSIILTPRKGEFYSFLKARLL